MIESRRLRHSQTIEEGAIMAQGSPPSALSEDEKAKFLAWPPPVTDRTFELGLVLGGTVSAGAYTAGALDFLIQALDHWHGQNPPHKVLLRLAAGTSGGAVCAAVLGVSLNKSITPVRQSQAELNVEGNDARNALKDALKDNPFWQLWVESLDLNPMLDTDDLDQDQPARALLNDTPIKHAMTAVLQRTITPGTLSRPWVANPFRVATTVCNLRGVPYTVAGAPIIGPYSGNAFVEHDDYAWFALSDPNRPAPQDLRPNEFHLPRPPAEQNGSSYDILGRFARASGAMPVGLPSQELSRPAIHYLYRPYTRVNDYGVPGIGWPKPDWSELPEVLAGGDYTFTGVDGGTMNNDPVKIAHDALAGVGQHNPRPPGQANRALLLIDPLVDKPTHIEAVDGSLVATVKAVINTFVHGSRYLTADLDLFQDRDVFSRFQLVPNRLAENGLPIPGDKAPLDKDKNAPVGEAALAGTDLFAMAGWYARPLRVHDYLLGRFNMATYLRTEMILRASNPVFDGWFPDRLDLLKDYGLTERGTPFPGEVQAGTDRAVFFLPIIPVPEGSFGVQPPEWPTDALDTEDLEALSDRIDQRVEVLLKKVRADSLPGFGPWLLSLVASGGIASALTDRIMDDLKKTLADRGLMSTPPENPPDVPGP
ncbi:patatin-like phospholipase family protein [Nitrospirillum viridazoti]|nr:patatin-like phospholipase family protein [Nitrospirillum amazonense]